MDKVIAINGSPGSEKGNTAMLLKQFLEGMEEAGAATEILYASCLDIKPCSCGQMYCWYDSPGNCCIRDEMQDIYQKLRKADILVLATPVYIPMPGKMQNIINRLCPLILPLLENHGGRTRARFREDVKIRKMVLVATGGWWEKENFDILVHLVKELAENASVEFAGSILRPHAFLMKKKGELTGDGKTVLNEARKAGSDLIRDGVIGQEVLDRISQPLILEEELRKRYNSLLNEHLPDDHQL